MQSPAKYKAVVFCSGKPRSFIVGADLHAIQDLQTAEALVGCRAVANHAIAGRPRRCWSCTRYLTRLRRSPCRPVTQASSFAHLTSAVAVVNGAALGGGLELALACDVRVGDRVHAHVGLPEVTIGVIPAGGGCTRLPRLVGLSAALQLILSGARADARPYVANDWQARC